MHLLLILLLATTAFAQWEGDGQGKITFENRLFNDDSDESTIDANTGLFLDFSHKLMYKNLIFQGKVVARNDSKDPTRDYIDLNEGYVGIEFDHFSLLVGSQIQNWSALEVFHPVDIFNPVNMDADFENREKLGQPAINANILFGNNQISLFYMPLFVAPRLPLGGTRLNIFPDTIKNDLGEYLLVRGSETREDRVVTQFAAKFDMSFDAFDLGLYYLHLYDRSNIAIATRPLGAPPFYQDPRPAYVMSDQFGMTLQYPLSDFVFKYEGLYKKFDVNNEFDTYSFAIIEGPDNHMINSFGVEYNHSFDFGHDITLLGEFQRIQSDSVNDIDNLGFFQNDAFFAIRWVFNNVNSSELFFGFLSDLERDEKIVSGYYSQRITDYWYIKGSFRNIEANEGDVQGLSALDNLQEYKINIDRRF